MKVRSLLPLAAAAHRLGLTPDRLRRLVCEGRVAGELVHARWLVVEDDVRRILAAGVVPDRPAHRGVVVHRKAATVPS